MCGITLFLILRGSIGRVNEVKAIGLLKGAIVPVLI